jgi:hypothetical protein
MEWAGAANTPNRKKKKKTLRWDISRDSGSIVVETAEGDQRWRGTSPYGELRFEVTCAVLFAIRKQGCAPPKLRIPTS